MTVQEVAKAVMWETKTSQADVARIAGLTGQSTVSMFLQSKSMRVDSLLQILNACGYELVARSGDGMHPEYVIGKNMKEKANVEANESTIEEMVKRLVAAELMKAGVGCEEKK